MSGDFIPQKTNTKAALSNQQALKSTTKKIGAKKISWESPEDVDELRKPTGELVFLPQE
jgi:hypothetical protein